MKIAHINYSYGQRGSSGTEQSVPNTCDLLEARGVETCVLYERPTGSPAAMSHRRAYGIPDLCKYSLHPNEAIIARALAVLETEHVDLVHLHSINNPYLVQAIAARWPTFYFVHNHVLTCPSGTRAFMASGEECRQAGPALSCVTNAYLRRCNSLRPTIVARSIAGCLAARRFARNLLLGVDSEYMKRTLVRSGYAADRIVVTPTVTEITPPPDDYYPTHTPPRVLYVGQLSEIKGAPLLLEALARLETPATLALAGEGYLRSQLEQQAARLHLTERVAFLGHVSRSSLADLHRQSSLLAVPTRYPEPFGLVGPEAMAQARPVVAFDIGAISEWLLHGVTGLLATPNDVDDFARRIDYLLAHPTEAQRMGQAGRRIWEERFHPDRHVAALLDAYAVVLGQPKGILTTAPRALAVKGK
jgi:glycosyltransferase involved in cell wall biosynthesis